MHMQAGHEAAECSERSRAGRHGGWRLLRRGLQLQLRLCRYASRRFVALAEPDSEKVQSWDMLRDEFYGGGPKQV